MPPISKGGMLGMLAGAGGGAGGAGNFYELLGRATVSSGDTLDTGTFTTKPYMMVLCYTVGSGTVHPLLHFNNDTASSYAFRYSPSGTSDVTGINQTYLRFQGGISGNPRQFSVGFFNSDSDEEKLLINQLISAQTTGAGNAPTREEQVGKWANTSNNITQVDANNGQSGDYASGTELVVLGYDPANTGTGVWEELASVELTGSQSTPFNTGAFTAKKYLWIQAYSNASTDTSFRVGTGGSTDTGSNYCYRRQINGVSDAIGINQTDLPTIANEEFINIFIINNSDEEKLFISELSTQNTAGAGNAPARQELVGKWINTSGQIDIFGLEKTGATYNAGSYIKVWGFD